MYLEQLEKVMKRFFPVFCPIFLFLLQKVREKNFPNINKTQNRAQKYILNVWYIFYTLGKTVQNKIKK